jgi:uncharacterized repeat protein (TIGR03803 family)
VFGGENNIGTIFKITSALELTALHSFEGPGPEHGLTDPNGLVEGDDGSFYGTTQFGRMAIFRLSLDHTYSELYNFHGTNGNGPGALTKGRDGNFYGVTTSGSAGGVGTLFQMTPNGAFRTLINADSNQVSLLGSDDGRRTLLQASDGRLYGIGISSSNHPFVFRFSIPVSALPALTIVRSNASIVLSWPVAETADLVLETAGALPASSWSTVSIPPIQQSDQMVVTVDLGVEPQYFRLRK